MRIVWAEISAWRDGMGQRLLSLQKHLCTHFRNISAVLAASVFRTCAFYRLARCTGLEPPPPSTLPYPASLRVSFLVCICGGTLGMGTEYSYFTTITPTCLCNYRLYRTFWCSGGTSVISWPAYGLGNRGSSEARISFSTACIQRSTYSEYGGSSSRCSSVPA